MIGRYQGLWQGLIVRILRDVNVILEILSKSVRVT